MSICLCVLVNLHNSCAISSFPACVGGAKPFHSLMLVSFPGLPTSCFGSLAVSVFANCERSKTRSRKAWQQGYSDTAWEQALMCIHLLQCCFHSKQVSVHGWYTITVFIPHYIISLDEQRSIMDHILLLCKNCTITVCTKLA